MHPASNLLVYRWSSSLTARACNHRCSVCFNKWNTNEPVKCSSDHCHNAVHKSCFGFISRSATGAWHCWACERSHKKQPPPVCYICKRVGGPGKKGDDDLWAHIVCALYIPEVSKLFLLAHCNSNIRLLYQKTILWSPLKDSMTFQPADSRQRAQSAMRNRSEHVHLAVGHDATKMCTHTAHIHIL